MARFALFTNGVKVETLEDLKENFSLKDIENNFRTKSLHRWLAEKGLREELKKVESVPPGADNLADLLVECFALTEEQKTAVKKRTAEEAKRVQGEHDVSDQLNADNSSPDAQSISQVINILMPNFGSSDGTLLLSKWHVKPGDEVKKGDILCTANTKRSVTFNGLGGFEIESLYNGRIAEILVRDGEEVPVSKEILKLTISGDKIDITPKEDISIESLKIKNEKVFLPRNCCHVCSFGTFLLAGYDYGNRCCHENSGVYISRNGGYSWIKHQRFSEMLGDVPLSQCKSHKLNSKWYLFAQGKGIFEFDEAGDVTFISETVCGDKIDFNECAWDITFDGREFVAEIGEHYTWDYKSGKITIYKFKDFCDPNSCLKTEIDLGCWITEFNFFKGKYFAYGDGFFESTDGKHFTRFIEPSPGRGGMFCFDDVLFINENDTSSIKKTRYTLDGATWHELPYRFNMVAKNKGMYYGWDYSHLYISKSLISWENTGIPASSDSIITELTFCSPFLGGLMHITRLPF